MLSGKNCIVTGSTGGIGKAIALSFLKEGAFVFIAGRSDCSVQSALDYFKTQGFTDTVHGIVANVATIEGSDLFFEQVKASGREIDVLCNNLGVFDTGDFFRISDEEWLQYFNTNVLSTVRFCREYLKPMLARNRGRVIIVSSEAGLRPIPDLIPYSFTKGAQINIARGLAELTKGTNVTVNSLLPGPTMTEGVDSFIDELATQSPGKTKEEVMRNFFKEREPSSLLQRFLTVEEVANVATFLASDLSSGVNGATQRVEGGIIRHV